MISKAKARYLRISTRKTARVAGLVRGMSVLKAEALLALLHKRPARYIRDVLRSAIDSADKKHVPASELYISLIKADTGPTIKRYRAASMGRATQFNHRTTHISLELDRIKKIEKKVAAEKKEEVKKPRIKRINKDKT